MPSKKKSQKPTQLVNWEDLPSPYRKPIHVRFRKYCREFVNKEIKPNIDKWEKQRDVPQSFYRKCYKAGLYSPIYPKQYGGTPFEDNDDSQHDLFMSLILYDEVTRAGSAGLIGAGWIHYVAVMPIIIFGSDYLKDLIRPVIEAEKFASLCVSEPTAGSDVRKLKCTAKLDATGENYIVNGEKYWITGGMKADYFTTAVRTGKPGSGFFGISMIVIPRCEGVTTTRLALQGHDTSATAYVIFRNVVVPKRNLIGTENHGFRYIMYNFNAERFGIINTAVGLARTCVEEACAYAQKRETFGKRLIQHQVIRFKIMEMTRKVLAAHSFMEWCAYRMTLEEPGSINSSLIKDISLLKVEATKCVEFCAREAAQIYGGRAYVKGGTAAKVERIYRDVRAMAIYGGSEEIMIDLAGRQA
eukprot:472799_1